MSRVNFALLTVLCLSLPSVSLAEERTLTVSGDAAMGPYTTLDGARRLAMERAKALAVERACGVAIQGETFVRNGLFSAEFLRASISGLVLEHRVVRQGTESLQKTPASAPAIRYVVEVEAKVRCEKGEPDPAYTLHASLNKETFRSGEALVLRVTASKDSYLTILNLGADGQVDLLRPNFVEKKSFITGGETVEIPSPRERRVFAFEVRTEGGRETDRGSLLVIATRRPVEILAVEGRQGELLSFETPELTLKAVARWLAGIAVAERTGAVAHYVVRAR